MNKKKYQKLTLDQTATYVIKVPGALDGKWLGWNREMVVNIDSDGNEPITTITIDVDQAALHGLLKNLYSFGIPLISAVCKDYTRKADA